MHSWIQLPWQHQSQFESSVYSSLAGMSCIYIVRNDLIIITKVFQSFMMHLTSSYVHTSYYQADFWNIYKQKDHPICSQETSYSSEEEGCHMDDTLLLCTAYCLNATRSLVWNYAALRNMWRNTVFFFPPHLPAQFLLSSALTGSSKDIWDSQSGEKIMCYHK